MTPRPDQYDRRERAIALVAALLAVALALAIAPFDADDAPGRFITAADARALWTLLIATATGFVYIARR